MKIKICGITHLEDAKNAALFGADYVGLIFSNQSKRRVSIGLAKEIEQLARQMGVEPVGVFVDESIEEILSICKETKITTVQLYSPKKELLKLQNKFSIIYTIPVESDGSILEMPELNEFICPLFDYHCPGSGKSFNWENFSPPKNTPWMLAGGLNPENVAMAIDLLKPSGVDVASGVEFPKSCRKDPYLLKPFIQNARRKL